jgi:membrane dipeptidase
MCLQYFIFDGHNDLPWALRMASFTGRSLDLNQPQPQLHTDIARLKRGKVGAQFWSVWVPASLDDSQAVAVTLEQISRVWQLQQLYPDTFKICLSAADVDAAAASVPPKIASLIGMEGGHSIGGSIEVLASM